MAKLSLMPLDSTPEEKHKIQLKQKRVYNKKRSLYNKELRKEKESLYSETDTILYRDSLSPLGQVCLYRRSIEEITENGYISTLTTEGITSPPTDLRKCALNATYRLPMNQNRRVIARSILYSHIKNHLKGLKFDFDCKHPACSTSFRSLEELTYHLVDTHCWRPRRQSPKKRKRTE
ncbi:Zinc finger C2H2 [Penicillium soppii]|uniref:Zinc finger C2H2 n=1 Tax=Penicillium soppii TaxID=69789 RepID=UPI002548DB78|nr:Zinc finger C2H2 [Penicillium soppii]KAJ5882364.1 Zinc finger C2H2 [Penicillium soppii]